MLHWFSETFLNILNYVPALIVDEGSAQFTLIRAMFGLIILVIILCLFVFGQPAISRKLGEVRGRCAKRG